MAEIFKAFLLTSLAGSALTLLLTLLKPVTKKYFSAAWHYYMWLFVLLIMLLPIRLELPKVTDAEPIPTLVLNSENPVENTDLPIITMPQQETVTQNLPLADENVSTIHTVKNFIDSNFIIFSFVWLFGALTLFLHKIISYIFFLIKLHKHSEVISCPEVYEHTKRKVTVRVSNSVCSPLLTGIFRPTLLLPKTQMTAEQLHNILSHEITHLKRNDILYKWFVSCVKCIHWFNPCIYFVGKKINEDCEISCDLSVCKGMSKEEEIGYINTILSLLSAKNAKPIPLTTGMTGSKKTLKTRFAMIKNKIKISKKATVISLVSSIILLSVTVLASGILNGKFLPEYQGNILSLNTDKEDSVCNLLFLGLDNSGNADTIIILSSNGDIVSMVSVPRDTAFESPVNRQTKKLSELLTEENGDQKVIDAVRNKLSIPINYYAKLNLTALEDIVDIVGGIEFDIPMDMVYDDAKQDLHINLKKGRHLLKGKEICALLQFRASNSGIGYSDGDLSRIKVGQQFIKELVNQKLNKDYAKKLPEIYNILSDNVVSNFSLADISDSIEKLTNAKEGIVFYTLPGSAQTSANKMFYQIDIAGAGDILTALGSEFLLNESSEVTTYPESEKAVLLIEDSSTNSEDIEQRENIKIKSTLTSDQLYEGFEQLAVKNANSEKIQNELLQQGISLSSADSVDLNKHFITGDYSKNNSQINNSIKCDKNGNITLYLSTNQENLFNISFYDASTKKEVASYGIMANNENIYSFMGFDPEKSYNIVINDSTQGTFDIKGQYIIY